MLGGGAELAAGGQQHRATAQRRGKHPGAVEPTAVALQGVDEWLGIIESAHADHRLDGFREVRRGDDLGSVGKSLRHGQQRRDGIQRGLIVAAGYFQERPQRDWPFAQSRRAATLCGRGGLIQVAASLVNAARISGRGGSECQRDEHRKVAAQLRCALDGLVGSECSPGKVATPNIDEREMKCGKDQFVFRADTDALLTDCRHRFAGNIEIARPGPQQRHLNARTKSQRDWLGGDFRVRRHVQAHPCQSRAHP